MRPIVATLLALCAALFPLRGGEPITIGETLRLSSKILGEERLLVVSTPIAYGLNRERYPVIYLTDGGDHFLHVRGSVDFLVRNGLMPDAVIVGITNTDRTRDLTPTRITPEGTRGAGGATGGAGPFMAFLEQEVFPAIEARYRTAPCRIFAGHSLGGLLGLHMLAARPDLFNATLAASPSLAWDGDYPLRVLGAAMKERRQLQHTLFVTMGNEEAGDVRPTRFERLRALLSRARSEGFVWEAKALLEESHGTVVLPSYYLGLRKVFEGWGPAPDGRADAYAGSLADLQAHSGRLARRLGCALPPPEGPVNLMGYRFLGRGQVPDAVAVFRYNAANHPDSANVHDSLGEALEKAGSLDEALACYAQAVTLAGPGHPSLRVFQQNRARAAAAQKPGAR
jgi:predicted alpha/beta superfamily hydrolase